MGYAAGPVATMSTVSLISSTMLTTRNGTEGARIGGRREEVSLGRPERHRQRPGVRQQRGGGSPVPGARVLAALSARAAVTLRL